MILLVNVHHGTRNCNFQKDRYFYKRCSYNIFIINLDKTLEELYIVERVIVAIHKNIFVVCKFTFVQRNKYHQVKIISNNMPWECGMPITLKCSWPPTLFEGIQFFGRFLLEFVQEYFSWKVRIQSSKSVSRITHMDKLNFSGDNRVMVSWEY